jgi:hypothetical protein
MTQKENRHTGESRYPSQSLKGLRNKECFFGKNGFPAEAFGNDVRCGVDSRPTKKLKAGGGGRSALHIKKF